MKHTVSLKENRQFRRLYARGTSLVSPHMVFYWRKTGGSGSRLGITVSGKLGKAVVRNKIRRRLREIYRTNESALLPGVDLVIVARGRALRAAYGELERSFLKLCKKAGFLRQDMGQDSHQAVKNSQTERQDDHSAAQNGNREQSQQAAGAEQRPKGPEDRP